jgi:TP901 family phage tail tape measure protein
MGANASGSGGWMTGVADMAVGAYQKLGAMVVEKLTAIFSNIQQFVTEAPGMASKFQAAMLRFSAAAAIEDPVQLEKMNALFMDLGARLPVTVTEVTAAATTLAKGGIGIETMAGGMLEALIKFSLAAEMDVPQAADTAIKFLGTFGDASWDAGQKVEFVTSTLDLLQKGANTSTLDASGFAGALIQSAGAATTAGVELKDYMTTMAAISGGFGSASEEATSLREVINRLNPTQRDAREKMRELGLITYEYGTLAAAATEMGLTPMTKNIGELESALIDHLSTTKKWSEIDISKFLLGIGQNVFYTNGELNSMTSIVGELEKAFSGLTEEERGQAMRKIFEVTGTNAAAQLLKLGTKGMADYEKQMDSALGTAAMYERTFQGLEAAQTNSEGSLESLQLKIGGFFLPAMEKYENAVALTANTLGTLITLFSGGFPLGELSKLSPTMQDIVLWINMAQYELNWWFKSLEPSMQPLIEVWGLFEKAFAEMWVLIQPLIEDLSRLWFETFGESSPTGIAGITKIAVEFIVETIRLALQIILVIIRVVVYVIAGLWELFGDSLVLVIVAAYDIIVTLIEGLALFFSNMFGFISAVVRGDWAAMWEYMKKMYYSFTNAIAVAIAIFVANFIKVFYTLAHDIGVPMMQIMATIGIYLAGIIDSVINWIADLTGWFGKIDLKTAARDMMTGFISEFKKYTKRMIDDVSTFATDILKTFGDIFKFGSPSKVMKLYGGWIGEGLSVGINQSVPKVAESTNRMVSAIDRPMTTINNTTEAANNYFNLGIKTTASPTTIVRSYDVMRVMI